MNIIRQSNFMKAVDIIAQSDKLVRALELKQVGTAFNKAPTNFDLSRQERQAAAAAYMMRPGDNHGNCKQCADEQRAKGPCKECVADTRLFSGSCFNCHYSGRGGSCSFAVEQKRLLAFEAESAQERKRAAASRSGELDETKLVVIEEDLRKAETSQLERWISMMQDELARRRATTATLTSLRRSNSDSFVKRWSPPISCGLL